MPSLWPAFAAGAASGRKLRILFLGGTGFLGPHTVRAALECGHELTLFNRGKTAPDMFADLEHLRGDRDGDLGALAGKRWDAVIDTSGYVPRIVTDSASLLADAVGQYVFISTISVYASSAEPGMDESAPLATLADKTVEEITGETYGPLKALSEQAAERAMPGRVTVIRPGLIVGPGDETDRFTYWPVRVARGGEVLAPGKPDTPVQFIDVRDLGAWIVHCLEARVLGRYNALSPAGEHSMGELLETCRDASGNEARFTWVPADFLAAQGIAPWSDMPMWLPPAGDYAGSGLMSAAKAVAAGLRFRPLESTAADTLAWWRNERGGEAELRAGIDAKREQAVLAAWHAHEKAGDSAK
ncbi:MAG: SDR family oxidoreductase [Gammaproteobacteria bacterium]|nr:SDR family oxidoreductase [Gammaproteobacteria bacterium]